MAERRSATGSPTTPTEIIEAALPEGGQDDIGDADSAIGNEIADSTASVATSILKYRTIHGRTFHSERFTTQYFTPNDNQQTESIDLTHHYLTLLLNGKLILAPIKDDLHKVVDIGTGTGIWAIDFADAHPECEVIGTDLSPIQPSWVPPNVKFEIDDALQPWTWAPNTFDFVHIRYLFGGVADWNALFREAYRCCKPGGWLQSCECDVKFLSDDGTTDGDHTVEKLDQLYQEGGRKTGCRFTVVADDLQKKGIEAAGFEDIQVQTFKLPVGGWPRDQRLAEVGRILQLTMLNDLEGYTLFMWKNIMEWPMDEYQLFLMELRKVMRYKVNRTMHAYMTVRYVYGRKPEES